MINKLLVGTALAVVPAAAMAADLPVRSAAPAPVFVAAAPTWAGFYVGANVGVAWSSSDLSVSESCVECSTGSYPLGSTSGMGALAGVTAGYNFQSGNFVYGLEADFQGVFGNDRKSTPAYFRGGDFVTSNEVRSFGTLRARAGIASGATLFYLTAGVAAVNTKFTGSFPGCSDCITYSNSNWEWAGVLGAGIEHQLGGGWSAKVEGLYIPQVKNSATHRYENGDSKTYKTKSDIAVIRFGVNYRFGAAASAPVVARY